MQLNNFSLEQVVDRHPLTVFPETRLTEVIRRMQERTDRCYLNEPEDSLEIDSTAPINHHCALVIENTQLQGIFTERDLVRLIAAERDLAEITVAEVMNRELITLTVTGSEDVFTALNLLRQHSIRHLPVIDQSDRLLGLITQESLSSYLASQVEQQTLDSQKRLQQEQLATTIALRIRQSLNLESIFQATVTEVRQLIQADRVLIYRFEADWSGMVTTESVSHPQWSIIHRLIKDSCFEQAWLDPYQQGHIHTNADINRSNLSPCHIEFLQDLQVKANVALPILLRNENYSNEHLWGLLIAHQCSTPRNWQESELEMLQLLAVQIAIAIQQGELYQQVQTELNQRQQAETKVRQQAALLNLTHDTILVRNRDNIITFWNRGAVEMYGWTVEEALGKNSHQLLQTEFPQPLAAIETELLRQGRWSGELIHRRKDGTAVIVMGRWSLSKDATGNPEQILEINHDISERQQAEAKIRQQAALLDVATDAIMVRGLDHKILFWNRGAEKIYGWTKSEALNKNANELLYRQFPPELKNIQQVVRKQGEWQGELNQVTKAGKDIVVQSRWTLVRDEIGNPQSYLVVKTDITEQKQLEAQFLRTQRLESLGTLAGGIAHDLNNILAPIMGFAKLLPLKLPNSDEQTRNFFQIIETNAQRGSALVKQILTFARGLESDRGIVQIRHLIAEIKQIIEETFPKNIQLEINASKNLWTVNGDLNQFHQILMNLAVNARDAMPHGGTLTIKAENCYVDAEYARLHLDATEGSYVLITVADTGEGIPPEIIERIFEPFFTTKQFGKGTGLGLSTVIGIVKSHGGFVDVTSNRGRKDRGTQVKVFLPASETEISATEETAEIPHGNGELILVIDDEPAILEVTTAILETYNYRVLTANNGIEGIATYANNINAIDLVITDIMMPSMDGKTEIRTLKEINPNIKIIAVSGLISSQEIIDEIDQDISAFIAKPYSNEELLRAINEILAVN